MPIVSRFGSAYSVSSGSTWTTPENIYADDGAYAVTAGARNVNWDLIVSGFGFNIPSNAIINSVTFDMEYKLSTTASASTLTFQSLYDGVVRGTDWVSTAEPIVDTLVNKTDNGIWTADELNSSLMQGLIRVRRTSNTACNYSFDYVKVTVDYTEQASVNVTVDVTEVSMTLGGYDAEITIQNPVNINIDTTESNIQLTGYDSIITVSTNIDIDQDFTNISLTGYDSTINTTSNINIDSTYSNITTQGYDIIVSTEAVLNNNIDASYSNLQLNGYDSIITVSTNVNIDQTFSNIGFIGYDVNINTTKNLNIDSTYTNITLQGYDTTVSTEASQSINIDVLVSNLSIEGCDIQVLTTANVAIDVANNTLTVQGYNVSVYAGGAEEPPFVDILSATQYKLSYDVNYDSTVISFSFDKPVVEYRINLLGISPNTGTVLDTERKDVENMAYYTVDQVNDLTVLDAMSFDADLNITDEILATELSLGENRINIYGLGLNDLWTPYEE